MSEQERQEMDVVDRKVKSIIGDAVAYAYGFKRCDDHDVDEQEDEASA